MTEFQVVLDTARDGIISCGAFFAARGDAEYEYTLLREASPRYVFVSLDEVIDGVSATVKRERGGR